jgi:hypothetical protein
MVLYILEQKPLQLSRLFRYYVLAVQILLTVQEKARAYPMEEAAVEAEVKINGKILMISSTTFWKRLMIYSVNVKILNVATNV